MNLPYYISKRLTANGNSFSAIVHKIALASISVGLAIMLISVMILGGFTSTIENKIFSFSGHFQILKFTVSNSLEEAPFAVQEGLFAVSTPPDFVEHLQEFGHKASLLKNGEEIEGVLLKGVGRSFDTTRFADNLVEGRFIHIPDSGYSREVLISKKIARLMRLSLSDDVTLNFMDFSTTPPSLRTRRLSVVGLYDTGLEDFDDHMVIGDLGLIRRMNNWPDSLVGGYELFVNNYGEAGEIERWLYDNLDYDLYPYKASDKYAQFFDWMRLISKNEVIFLVIITFVACFNMASVLLIMIMERTQMIGLLKALGAANKLVRRVFIYRGMQLIAKGMLIGNLIGLGLAYIQDRFKLIPLNPQNYYMEYVPIQWDWSMVILLNFLTFIIITSVLVLPTMIISRIQPIRAIRFD